MSDVLRKTGVVSVSGKSFKLGQVVMDVLLAAQGAAMWIQVRRLALAPSAVEEALRSEERGLGGCSTLAALGLYTALGGALFLALEGGNAQSVQFNSRAWLVNKTNLLFGGPEDIPLATKEGMEQLLKEYDKRILTEGGKKMEPWTFWSAAYYATTIYSTIGYGNVYCQTMGGQVMSILYGCVGIPLMVTTLNDLGKLLQRLIGTLCEIIRFRNAQGEGGGGPGGGGRPRRRKARRKGKGRSGPKEPGRAREGRASATDGETTDVERGLPRAKAQEQPAKKAEEEDSNWLAALVATLGWMFFISLVFYAKGEKGFVACFYFVFVSLSTIGFGDIVFDANFMLLTFLLVMVGLSLLSMCIHVVQLEIALAYRRFLRRLLEKYRLAALAGGADAASLGLVSDWQNSRQAKFIMSLMNKEKAENIMREIAEQDQAEGLAVPEIMTQLDSGSGMPSILRAKQEDVQRLITHAEPLPVPKAHKATVKRLPVRPPKPKLQDGSSQTDPWRPPKPKPPPTPPAPAPPPTPAPAPKPKVQRFNRGVQAHFEEEKVPLVDGATETETVEVAEAGVQAHWLVILADFPGLDPLPAAFADEEPAGEGPRLPPRPRAPQEDRLVAMLTPGSSLHRLDLPQPSDFPSQLPSPISQVPPSERSEVATPPLPPPPTAEKRPPRYIDQRPKVHQLSNLDRPLASLAASLGRNKAIRPTPGRSFVSAVAPSEFQQARAALFAASPAPSAESSVTLEKYSEPSESPPHMDAEIDRASSQALAHAPGQSRTDSRSSLSQQSSSSSADTVRRASGFESQTEGTKTQTRQSMTQPSTTKSASSSPDTAIDEINSVRDAGREVVSEQPTSPDPSLEGTSSGTSTGSQGSDDRSLLPRPSTNTVGWPKTAAATLPRRLGPSSATLKRDRFGRLKPATLDIPHEAADPRTPRPPDPRRPRPPQEDDGKRQELLLFPDYRL